MSATPVPALGILVDHDPAIWLPGPVERSRDEWLDAAYLACAADFDVQEGSAESALLREVLTAFVDADLGSDLRFLHLRALIDIPVVARVTVSLGTTDGSIGEHFADLEQGSQHYDREARVDVIDESRQLRRALAFRIEPDGMRSVVRYHRRVEEWHADVVLSCAGADLKATALVLDDLDELSRAVWFVDEGGNRR